MTVTISFRIEESDMQRLVKRLQGRNERPGKFIQDLLVAWLNLEETAAAAFDPALKPLVGCATCNRTYGPNDARQLEECRKAGHFIVPL